MYKRNYRELLVTIFTPAGLFVALAALANAGAFGASSNRATDGQSPSWAIVPAGVFQMGAQPGPDVLTAGSDRTYAGPDWDEAPVHEVRISRAYALGLTKVTQREFARFKPKHQEFIADHGITWDPEAPVVLVTWTDAMNYCRWRSEQEGEPIRLPTEAEWELAARNAERLGLRGMSDGILEWCLDWCAPYAADAVTDPFGPRQGEIRIARGRSGERTETTQVEVKGVIKKVRRVVKPSPSDRSGTVPEDCRPNIGFRVVRAPMPAGTWRAALPVAAVFRDVSPVRMDWKPPAHREAPVFSGGVAFFDPPADPLALPYFGRHHVPSIVACDNGDLLVTAMTCPADSSDQMVILISRLRRGRDQWDPPARFFVAPDRDVDSAVLFNAGNGELHHYNSVGGGDHRFVIVKRVSTDNGATWSPARIVHRYAASPESPKRFSGEPRFWSHLPIVRLSDGTIVMPSDAGYSGWSTAGTVLWGSRDLGESWSELTRYGWNAQEFGRAGGQAGWIAGVHASFVVLKDGSYLAPLGRDTPIEGHAPMSMSGDGGRTWTYRASSFPAILSSQRPALFRLREGPILLVSYTDTVANLKSGAARGMDFVDDAGSTRKGNGMFATLSLDEGKTWRHFKLIPSDAAKPWESDGGGYLYIVQTPDGIIHMVSSRKYYRFNLAWLKTPPPAMKR